MSKDINFDQNNEIQEQEIKSGELELFAEELADQTDLASPNFCTAATIGSAGSFSTATSCGGSASSGSSISSAC